MPKRIQLSRKKGSKLPPNTIIVSRQNWGEGRGWGNPYNWKTDYGFYRTKRRKTLAQSDFRNWMNGNFEWHKDFFEVFTEQREWILAHLPELVKADFIACWCKTDEPCHGDVLIDLIEEMEIE